ncbi:hypothetical protein SBOR_7889 [Sclerotinia borealis F-4128]|uniref:Short-chain dehydrogenase/reductase ABA4 n=1 Tax=Sclerotinia borealis (strain F-4128) TaxID=1432307 RepID=W9C7I9_SCLBF|nr:hypothetical protein SBOR_7889 [Sclerotinia borealis F-4128]
MPPKKPKQSATTPESRPPNWPPFKPLKPSTNLSLETIVPDQIITISNFWTSTLCKDYVSFLKTLPLTTTPGKPKKGDALRVNDRFRIDDWGFAERLWRETGLKELLCGEIEKEYEEEGERLSVEERKELWGGDVVGLNPAIRIYRYSKGQFFDCHLFSDDESNLITLPTKPTPTQSKTTWTLLLYLTSPATGCQGGETVFYPEELPNKKSSISEPVVIGLETGMVLLHKHGNDLRLRYITTSSLSTSEYYLLLKNMFVKLPVLRSFLRAAKPVAIPLRTLMTLPSFSLEGKTCVVTGAGRGIGKECLTAFALSGARGACVDLSHSIGEKSIDDIKSHIKATNPSYKPDLRPYECDVASEEAVQKTWAKIVEDFGHVDVVVTAAGIVENFKGELYPFDRWKRMMDINLNGSFLFAREAGKYWIEKKSKGSLILVSSMSSMICIRPQKQAAYNASKGAVSMLGKSLATEWGPYGIRVNNLCPGYVKTDLIIQLLEKEGKHIEENWIKDIPMGRLSHPSELQGTLVYMASDASSYLNGCDLYQTHTNPPHKRKQFPQTQLLHVITARMRITIILAVIFATAASARVIPAFLSHPSTETVTTRSIGNAPAIDRSLLEAEVL